MVAAFVAIGLLAAALPPWAPADEYFGRARMSFLGINNTLRDAAISSGQRTTDLAIVHRVAFAEDALEAWARKYPNDPQLARSYFLAMTVECKIWIQDDQARAWMYLNRIASLFPHTYFGKLVRKEIATGFTEHYYAPAVTCATPLPDATASALVVEATPVPIPTATPGPAELTLGPHLKAQVLPQPCLPEAARRS